VAGDLSRDDMRRLARLGAMRRLEELRREESMIRSAFPELFDGRAPKTARAASKTAGAARPRARKRRVSAAARKAASERMKKYWAERRKAKSKA
jgi:hypothetical protein